MSFAEQHKNLAPEDGWMDGWMNNKSQYHSTFSGLVIIKFFFGNTEFSRNYLFEIVKF
jgi:hypothetical protein